MDDGVQPRDSQGAAIRLLEDRVLRNQPFGQAVREELAFNELDELRAGERVELDPLATFQELVLLIGNAVLLLSSG